MKSEKYVLKKGEFIDKNFGDKVEYVRIYDGKGIILIFTSCDEIIVKKFNDVKEVIEKYIEKYIEAEFFTGIVEQDEIEFEELQEENNRLKNQIKTLLIDYDIADENEINN